MDHLALRCAHSVEGDRAAGAHCLRGSLIGLAVKRLLATGAVAGGIDDDAHACRRRHLAGRDLVRQVLDGVDRLAASTDEEPEVFSFEGAADRPTVLFDRDGRRQCKRLSDALGLDAEVEVVADGDQIRGVLHGDDMGLFIGRHGQTIDAVQHLAYRIALAHGGGERRRIVIDAEGYRARREEALHRQADQAADDAVRYKRPVALDAMTASERKIVHEYLRDRGDVETYSEGEEPDRHLVVAPLR